MKAPAVCLCLAVAVALGGAGCMSKKKSTLQEDLRPPRVSGPSEKSLYEMAVSTEAARLRKENPKLSQKAAVKQARKNIPISAFANAETPAERNARELKEAQKKFAADLERSQKP